MPTAPSLFGLNNANRDFTKDKNWGKNQFNSSFPAALACYMYSKGLEPVYLILEQNLNIRHSNIKVFDLFGLEPTSPDIYYAFETIFSPYEAFIFGNLPRIDLVTYRKNRGLTHPLRALEIKLTALPDNSTCTDLEENYGSEIVVRPDTIVYLALSIATAYIDDRDTLYALLEPIASKISDWAIVRNVFPYIDLACDTIDKIIITKMESQRPLMMQPIWKTEGKRLILNNNCLDIFVWSDFAFTRLFIDVARRNDSSERITRHKRCVLWLTKMLYDFARTGKINHQEVIDQMTYDTKNDKAFAVGGLITRNYLRSSIMINPRIKRDEIKNIILGGGEKLLSPERRFDAAIISTPGLFD